MRGRHRFERRRQKQLLGYLVGRQPSDGHPRYVLVDGNRLPDPSAASFLRQVLEAGSPGGINTPLELDALAGLEVALRPYLSNGGVCFLLDLSLLLDREGRWLSAQRQSLWGNLRALCDRHKFALTYVIATRHRLPRDNEVAELFFGQTVWLGPFSDSDARWNVARYAQRIDQQWESDEVDAILALSGRYPALLRGVCEACASGTPATHDALVQNESIVARVDEFWADQPEPEELKAAGLLNVPLFTTTRPTVGGGYKPADR